MKNLVIVFISLVLSLLSAQTVPREVEAVISGDFPPGERIDPDVISLNGKDAREAAFKPGKYKLDIQHPGYASLKEELLIPPGKGPFLLERILITTARSLKEKISYDVKPPENLAPYQITMAPVEKPKSEKIVKEGDMIKPGLYILRITKEAYEVIETKKYVWPAAKPFVIENQLIAKQVQFCLNVVYDIEPPANLAPFKFSLIDKLTGIPCFVYFRGKKVRPGAYFLYIQRPGYKFGPRLEIEILPSEQPYRITQKLFARPRRLAFEVINSSGNILVSAQQILVNGNPVSKDQTFLPGSEVMLELRFARYQTVRKQITIIPGAGPFIVKVPLVALKAYGFYLTKPYRVFDGIKYNYRFYADSKKIEDHLSVSAKERSRFYFQIWVHPQTKNLKVAAGYMFALFPVDKHRLRVVRMANIDVAELIKHLERKSANGGRSQALQILEKMLESPRCRHRLKLAGATAIDQLRQYVKTWKDLFQTKEQVKAKILLNTLDGLGTGKK